MTIFSVHHTTTYRYKSRIRPGVHQLMFRPRDSFDQRLLDCRLEITPAPAEVRWIHDAFGNCITLVDFNTETTSLRFDTAIRLDHTPENAPDFRIEDYARTHPFDYSDEELPDLALTSVDIMRMIRTLSIGLPSSSILARAHLPASFS